MFAQVKLMISGKFAEFHKKLGTNEDLEFRVRTAVKALEDVLPLDVQCECKDSQVSSNLRKEADRLFFEEKGNLVSLLQAWEFYSKSIALAESSSRELPLAYANRSAILYNLKKYEQCVRDINRALELNYPDTLKANLLRRKAKCLKLLGKPEAEDVCEEAKRWLQNIKLNDKNKEQLEHKIQTATQITELPKVEDISSKKSLLKFKRHERISCASDAIDLKYDEANGRHTVANRDINVGEILVFEKPYALLLKPERIYTHCSHCFIRAWDSIPCPNCIHAMYCSTKCRDKAWEQYHDIECPIKGYFLSLTMNDLAPFSLKLAILAVREAGGIDKLRQQLKEVDSCTDPLTKGFSEENIYRSDIYKPLYCLESHKDKRWLQEVVSMTMNVAVILYFVFTLTSFFGETTSKSLEALSDNEDAIFIGKLIAHHYMIIQVNDHEINEIDHNGCNHSLGAVVFPFSSLLNHSCNPNATRIPVIGEDNSIQQIIIAQHPIKKGSQIYDDYGFDFAMENASIEKRKELCNKYYFTCECLACKENWPKLNDLPSIFSFSLGKERKTEVKKAVNKTWKYGKSISFADVNRLDAESKDVLKTLAQAVTILYKCSSQPSKEFYHRKMLPPDQILSILKLDGLVEEIKNKNDCKQRVQITLQAIEKMLPLDVKCEQKDSKESKALRNEADTFFVKRKGDNKALFKALQMYTKSIALAENSSTELAQAYANRSAILFNLDKLEECIRDIDRALELSYPDHLKANLLRRKAKCLKLLDKTDFDKVCEEARQWLENMTVSDEKKEKLESKIVYINKELGTKSQLEQNEDLQKITLPEIIRNETIPSASDAISIKYTNVFGRHLVASRDIDVGEILVIEKPYASVLSSPNIYTHCSQCFKRTWDSIPCDKCIYAMYCSEKCRSEAWQQYHDIECSIKGYLIGLRMNDLSGLSLKLAILAVRESGSIRKLRKKIRKIDNCEDYLMKSISEDGIYHSDEYRPFYSLVTHEQNRKRYDLLALSLNTAITLYYLFSFTSFLGDNTMKDLSALYENEDAMFLGKLIAKHHMQLELNDHQFNEVYNGENIKIGSVIGSVTSLLNHSCNPNVGRCSRLQDSVLQQVIIALHPIKEGSQILDDYGCNFAFTLKSERDKYIERFFFKCNCIACKDIWPLFEDLPSILSIITDKEKKVEVARAIIRSKKHHNTITELRVNKHPGDKETILSNLIDSIKIVFEATSKPNREYIELIQLFCQAFVLIHGNFFELH
ncbi:hypothetical protein TSAR_010123 [Trichomalopsis sarcophagae]|uniref:Protein-lysine N-methyltransferase SMYD4 n=1 Tax=Trichomalopsis sarcophagae TaxID=543379 RepID=A0A232EEI5_9HYME|nr:hypothetical protein TSAR_010123 [Trichomalopsis sarcophagae]